MKASVLIALIGASQARKMMFADDFDDEQNGGEAHPQEEREELPESEPQGTLAQSSQAEKAKAALQ